MFKNFMTELKDFILRGNVLDMAVGIIIGAAFGKVIDSLVRDIIMPPIGLILGKVDFSNLYFQIYPRGVNYPSLEAAQNAGAVSINYGVFINTIMSFIIIYISIFIVIKAANKLRSSRQAKEITVTKECPFCCSIIPLKAKKCPNCTSEL